MTASDRPRRPRRAPRARLAALLAAIAPFSPGCEPAGGPPLVVATTWPAAARGGLEAAYRRESGDPVPVRWVAMAPGERLADAFDRREGLDLLLGGSVPEFRGLTEAGRLLRVEPADAMAWRIARRPGGSPGDGNGGDGGGPSPGYNDPRDSPSALGQAKATLGAEGWARGYETLVRRASRSRPSSARLAGGSSALGEAARLDECVGIATGSRHYSRAVAFLRAMESRGLVEAPPAGAAGVVSADGLLADLLGAALVDAREELRDAEAALRRRGRPRAADGAIGERPPWPPASVAKLLVRPSDAPLVDTLAEQVAPDPEARAWLRASWSRPGRAVDAAMLAELAAAADGRLAREPRFRAWLRGEWTAWARQLYRRVARVAGGWTPS